MSDARDFIEAVRREREEEIRFFSNVAKPERERWVVSQFLTRLGVTFKEGELLSPEQDDEVDVHFREARFQVKEIPEPGLRRGYELNADLRRSEHATRVSDLFEVGEPRDLVPSSAFLLMLQTVTSPKYPPTLRVGLDLLFYVTRTHSGLGSEEERQKLAAAGWRSISCLYGSRSLLLAATGDAPVFLQF